MLPRRSPDALPSLIASRSIDDDTLAQVDAIIRDVVDGGVAALRRRAEQLDGLADGAPLVLPSDALDAARQRIDSSTRQLLERTAERIARFADAQRKAISELRLPIPGGFAGHNVTPVGAAGCYAPGGRYPLPSSVLMTAVTARVAGVERVVVASPRPNDITLAAAAIAGADAVLAVGGAQAIAALAYGVAIDAPVDVIVGPGNRWVTAAKQRVSERVGIDMLAGPSELVIIADDSADAEIIAADLLAQAEHDPDARVVLLTDSAALADACDTAIARQLGDLATAEVARAALAEGASIVCRDLQQAVGLCNRLAPEHLQLHTRDDIRAGLEHYGALFIGDGAAEVLGDYGAGPNHVLPTAGTARHRGGLSVLDFLRVRTWLQIDDRQAAAALYDDARALAELEGLVAHGRAAARRL